MAPSVFDRPEVDRLYAAPLDEFTAQRNALAKSLRDAGDKVAADTVKKLRKPTVVAWAVNQVARAEGDAIRELCALGARLQDAQAGLLQGDDPSTLRNMTARRRQLVHELAGRAAGLVGEQHRSAAAATLEAASLDPDRNAELEAGRLAATLDPPSGFGLAGMPEPPAEATRQRQNREALQRADREVERLASALEEAERRLRGAEERFASAQASVERARSDVHEARQELDESLAERDRLAGR